MKKTNLSYKPLYIDDNDDTQAIQELTETEQAIVQDRLNEEDMPEIEHHEPLITNGPSNDLADEIVDQPDEANESTIAQSTTLRFGRTTKVPDTEIT